MPVQQLIFDPWHKPITFLSDMNRIFILLSSVLLLASHSCTGPDSPESKPNVVFILVDDLGWADLGCYGSTFHETPNIDQLAGESMRFTSAYAACPVCFPTRTSIMTGKYPARTGVTDWIAGRQVYNAGLPLSLIHISEPTRPTT